jgi:hypothetical protein
MNTFDPGNSRDIRLIRPDTPTGLPFPISKSPAHGRTERTDAWIVLSLTFACTAASLYDLLLLASG